jgi:hypothetical protein
VLVLNRGREPVPELCEELALAPEVGAPAVPVHGQQLGERLVGESSPRRSSAALVGR